MILDKDVLVNNILTELSDNSTGQISPYDIRHNLLDVIDSVHLLTKGKPLDGSNFGTPATRTTRIGEESLSKIHLADYFSIDNTAVGFSSLKSNYQSEKNTAIGSHSLFCNVYGENNVGLGYSSLGGNTVGHGNVGLGNFTLNNNKGGNFNIAIGHGAGYYATNDTSNKLFIASHPINSEYICDNPLGSGLTPLVYGDLSSLRFGIAVNSLHSDGKLQVGGHITPSINNGYSLGSTNYKWRYLYLNSGIYFSSSQYLRTYDSSTIELKSNFIPSLTNSYSLGSYNNLWASGLFNDVYVSGTATMNRFVAIETCNFFNKSINLATSGNISLDGGGPNGLYDYSNQASPLTTNCGYLPDQSLTGAGFTINASGTGYLRTYSLLFAPSNSGLSCLQTDTPYSRSSWNSNISLHIDSGCHLRTDRIIFPSSINIVNSSGCYGIFSRGSGLFLSKSELVSHNQHPSGYLAGVGDVNFYATSGDNSEYVVNFAVPDSGVVVKHRLLTGIKKKTLDNLNNNADKLSGFEFQYIDNSTNNIVGPMTDRLVIGSYHNTSLPVHALTLMKNNDDEGIVGITNISPNSQNLLPATSLNIRSANNAIGRFTAENQANTKAALQLLGGQNCLENGFEVAYLRASGLTDMSMYTDSGREVYIRLYEGIEGNGIPGIGYNDLYRIGILNSVSGSITSDDSIQGMISIGSPTNKYASISMREYEYGSPVLSDPPFRPSSKPNRAIFFIGKKQKPQSFQQHSMYLIDGSGYAHDLVVNKYDVLDGRGLFTDDWENTFGGKNCPDRRDDLTSATQRNTAIGYRALYGITTGDDNTILGANAASGLTTGSRNIIIGSNTANKLTQGSNNIVIGTDNFNNTFGNTNYNIILGNNGVANSISGNYNFIVGHSGQVLLHGFLGPNSTDKCLIMPNNGRFMVNDSTNVDSLQFRANYIDMIDRGGNDYPNNTLTFSFTGNETGELLYLNHAADPMSNNVIYESPAPLRPYAQLQGDLKLRGAIRFSDYTSLSSASFLTDISILQSGVTSNTANINTLFTSFVEGYTNMQIDAPSNPSIPTTGTLFLKNQNWNNNGAVNLVNRDTTSVIQSGAYVIAIRVNNEFRPLWISASDTKCQCCR